MIVVNFVLLSVVLGIIGGFGLLLLDSRWYARVRGNILASIPPIDEQLPVRNEFPNLFARGLQKLLHEDDMVPESPSPERKNKD